MPRINFISAHRSVIRLRQLRVLLVGALIAFMLPAVIGYAETNVPFPAPTLLLPEDGELLAQEAPVIVGVAKNNSVVRVYVDGTIDGQILVDNDPTGTADFAYIINRTLASGTHSVSTVAVKNGTSKTSKQSNRIVFDVVASFPAPTLFAPVVNDRTTAARPYVVGVARNDSVIKVMVDGALDGQFAVTNNATGTASFAYRTLYDLSVGKHTLSVIAEGSAGRVSESSNVVNYTVPDVTFNGSATETQGEVLGEETVDESASTNTNSKVMEESTEDTNANANGEEAMSTEEEMTDETATDEETSDVNWPLVIGLGLLILVVIIAIFRIQRDETGSGDGGGPVGPLKDPFGPQPHDDGHTHGDMPQSSPPFPPSPPDKK